MKNVKKIITRLAPQFSARELEKATAHYKALEKQDRGTAELFLEVAQETYVPAEFKRLAAECLLDGLELKPAYHLANALFQFNPNVSDELDEAIIRFFCKLKAGNGLERIAAYSVVADQWKKTHPETCAGKTREMVLWTVPELRSRLMKAAACCVRDMSFARYREESENHNV